MMTAAAMDPAGRVVVEDLVLAVSVVPLSVALTGPGVGDDPSVGACVGDTVGTSVGARLGVTEGAFEGAAVGDREGLRVGAKVGDLVGPLGRLVGWPVGVEGRIVGVNDGR